ncbi:MAG TPA: 4-hydroxy-tetrahydrodipicolinate reductase [Candidatus Pullichristensenella excrementigallinarum]|uniref:4-hydroxy-tetrahydrodipicolinate reductase n=1 Tax=Candidatus Pullichristensenella excrementigallinarum TaxID=2840907 RepID=A0A9D1LB42_9FIRM|nr:4-hydroxy-tetrahydrodipicolinate reductase [Candidatus Pullichristensenella excrementigallinarum]
MKLILAGYGKMGHGIEELLRDREDVEILGIVHPGLFESPWDVPGKPDAIVDFSYPGNLENVLSRAEDAGAAAVLGTTGYARDQLRRIAQAAERIPVVHSSNYSLGVAVLRRAVSLVAPVLLANGFDAEIIETHHNQKADAPSGTAKALLNAIDPEENFERVYGRVGVPGARGHEIGIHAVRGGTVAGEHSVLFFGQDEQIELRHSAASRRIFAAGAVKALQFAVGRKPGLYSIDDVLGL